MDTLTLARPKKLELSEDHQRKKEECEASLEAFITTIVPKRILGNIQRKVILWWTRHDAKSHQLVMLPRDHMKSALVAFRVVWELTRDPTLKVLYISSTSNLATKQLKFMKDIFTCDNYRRFWPEMVNPEEALREKWTEREISLDHPRRKEEAVREPSIFTAGLTTNVTGLHCDIAVLDDVVVQANAYTEDGREKVKEQYGYLSSVEGTSSREWVVGTRYHPKDLYNDLMNMTIEEYDVLGNITDTISLYEKLEYAVESIGDGTGEFLWPKQQRSDGKWFGFDQEILAKKRAQYLNRVHFRAQYYNDPHDVDSSVFKRDHFQYYEPAYLSRKSGYWYFKGERLNVVASIDFAFTTGKKSDYTAIVVVGVDGRQNYYVLEIDRFKTQQPSEQFKRLIKLFEKWGFRKVRCEVTGAQKALVADLRESYIRPLGLSLSVDEFLPNKYLGAKEERIMACLEPKYSNKQIWHYAGGNCQVLEEELIFSNPAHDDVKDALAAAVDFAVQPLNIFRQIKDSMPRLNFHSKFGGVQ